RCVLMDGFIAYANRRAGPPLVPSNFIVFRGYMNYYWSYSKYTSGLFYHCTGVWEEVDNRIIRKVVAFGGKRSIDFGNQASFDGWVFTNVINRKAEGVRCL